MSEVNENESAPESVPDLGQIMDSAIEDGEKVIYDAPFSEGAASSSPPAETPPEFVYDAPKSKTKRGPMGPVAPEMAELFTPDGVGLIFSRGVDAFYRACEAAPLSEDEDKLLRKIFAYYCQARMPADAGKYQPEIMLIGVLGSSLVPRLPQVAPATAPLFTRVGRAIWGFVSIPFRGRGGNESNP